MKRSLIIWCIVIYVGLFCRISHAGWYEVTGSSTIVSSQEEARLHALEDALYKAVSFSGADIGSIANLRPLLESNRSEYQFGNSEIRYIIVDDEIKRRGNLFVKARIDIYPSATACHFNQYKKTFLIGNIDIASPQQAVMGQIYSVGDDFATVINRQLDKESASFISVGTTDFEINGRYPERLKMIAGDTGAQYIMGGTITDLTATVDQNLVTKDQTNRQFALELTVFDGKTGNEVYQKKYREVALWPFARTSKVDTTSARFWASTYGTMMLRVSRNIMLDLESEISCKITLPEVIAKWDNKITIDLGRIHGVEAGDKLKLWHTGSFIDQRGLPRNKVSETEVTLTVSRVYENEAELNIDQPELASSVRIGDVMHKLL